MKVTSSVSHSGVWDLRDGNPYVWTTTPPTKPGYYWIIEKDTDAQDSDPVMSFVGYPNGNETIGLKWFLDIDGDYGDFGEIAYWFGPLPVPEPPE